MKKSFKIIEQIMELYRLLELELYRISPNPNSSSKIMDYSKTLPEERRIVLDDIRNFRNQCAFSSKMPELPENHKEWIAFLENEIALLKKD